MRFGFETVLCLLAICTNAIAAAAYYLNFNGNQDITAGYSPNKSEVNIGFYIHFSRFALGLICVVFGIIEILLIFIADKLSFLSSPLLRGIIYAFSGIAVLGCANDLGIAAGSLQLIIGAVMIVYGIIILIKH